MSRFIDADEYKNVLEKLRHRGIFPQSRDVIILRNYLDEFPTADVAERKDTILDETEAHYRFEYIDDHKNIVFKLPYALTDITDIRIRLDKYGLRENVKGEWIEDGAITKCSVCGNTSDYCGTENFCHHCGADMR